MDASLESVDNIPYQTPDQVKPVHHSEKEKPRQFAKALKEKMEEELRKERKKRARDEFLHGDDERTPSEEGTVDHEKTEKDGEEPTRVADDAEAEGPPGEKHIDLKA